MLNMITLKLSRFKKNTDLLHLEDILELQVCTCSNVLHGCVCQRISSKDCRVKFPRSLRLNRSIYFRASVPSRRFSLITFFC